MDYAVIPLAGTQFLVSEGDELQVNRVSQEEGETFTIVPFLVSKDKTLEIGMPETAQYQVSLSVVEHTKGEKLYVRRFKSKSRYRKKTGHRQLVSVLRVEEISMKSVDSTRNEAAGKTPEVGSHSAKATRDRSAETSGVKEAAGESAELPAGLSTRAKNALRDARKTNVSELKKMTKDELKEISGIGEKSAEEIIAKLK